MAAPRNAAALGADHARFVPTDVTDRASLDALYAATVDAYGRLDVVVNSAGAVSVVPFGRMKPEQWARTIAVNLTAAFEMSHEALFVSALKREERKKNSLQKISVTSRKRTRPRMRFCSGNAVTQ